MRMTKFIYVRRQHIIFVLMHCCDVRTLQESWEIDVIYADNVR